VTKAVSIDVFARTAATPLVVDAGSGAGVVVLDAALLTTATYVREGADLVLIGADGQTVLVRDYFANATPPDLVSATGGSKIAGTVAVKLAGAGAPGQYAQAQAAASDASQAIGRVETIEGSVTILRVDGTRAVGEAGLAIFQGDVLETGADGSIGLIFTDDSTFSLGDNARMVIDEMVFDPSAKTGKSVFSVVQGAFTFVSGEVAKAGADQMTITTPVMTIGIRGTAGAGFAGAEGTPNAITIVPQAGAGGIVVGEISITTAAGSQVINSANATIAVTSLFTPPPPPIILSNAQVTTLFSSAFKAAPPPPNVPGGTGGLAVGAVPPGQTGTVPVTPAGPGGVPPGGTGTPVPGGPGGPPVPGGPGGTGTPVPGGPGGPPVGDSPGGTGTPVPGGPGGPPVPGGPGGPPVPGGPGGPGLPVVGAGPAGPQALSPQALIDAGPGFGGVPPGGTGTPFPGGPGGPPVPGGPGGPGLPVVGAGPAGTQALSPQALIDAGPGFGGVPPGGTGTPFPGGPGGPPVPGGPGLAVFGAGPAGTQALINAGPGLGGFSPGGIGTPFPGGPGLSVFGAGPAGTQALSPQALINAGPGLGGVPPGGTGTPFPGGAGLPGFIFPLGILNGTNGFRLEGVAPNDFSGNSVAGAGDFNGDGFADLIVGATGADNTGSNSGSAYVVFGKASGFAAAIALGSLGAATGTGFRFDGILGSNQLGNVVASAGDVNGDGFADLIIGAKNANNPVPGGPGGANQGAAYVVFGNATGTAPTGPSGLTGANGFGLNGVANNDQTGISVGAGDFNADGFADLIIGAPLADSGGSDRGAVYVVFGKASGFSPQHTLDGNFLNGSNGFFFTGVNDLDGAGIDVAAAGDMNGDGFEDFVLSAELADPNQLENAGSVFVVFGQSSFSPTQSLSSLGTGGFRLNGAAAGDSLSAVASAGDVNGDGFDDLIVGASDADLAVASNNGAAYIVFGKASGFAAASTLDGMFLNGTNGFAIKGPAITEGHFGNSVSGGGDFNGDGIADLIVSQDPSSSGSASLGLAKTFVVFGSPAIGSTGIFDLGSLNGTNGGAVEAINSFDGLGSDDNSVSSAGDVNGDGFDDLIVGAQFSGPAGTRAGASYVVFGADFSNKVTLQGSSADNFLIGSVAADVIVGGQGNDTLVGSGGLDTLKGGQGNDVLAVSDMSFRKIDGGAGTDTLRLDGPGFVLDLTSLPNNKIAGIEVIDLVAASGSSSLVLSVRDLLDLSETSNTLQVLGGIGDSVSGSLISFTAGSLIGATVTHNVAVGANTFTQYTVGAATLLVDTDVTQSIFTGFSPSPGILALGVA